MHTVDDDTQLHQSSTPSDFDSLIADVELCVDCREIIDVDQCVDCREKDDW